MSEDFGIIAMHYSENNSSKLALFSNYNSSQGGALGSLHLAIKTTFPQNAMLNKYQNETKMTEVANNK